MHHVQIRSGHKIVDSFVRAIRACLQVQDHPCVRGDPFLDPCQRNAHRDVSADPGSSAANQQREKSVARDHANDPPFAAYTCAIVARSFSGCR